jgi:Ca2+-dependent lipid-binding protein
MRKEEKVEQNQITSDNFSKEKLEKAAGYFLGLVWAIALVMGLGFNSWSVFFIALVLTFSYLLKINGIKNSIKYDNEFSSSSNWNNNYLNPCNPTGSNMRNTRSNNYR